MGRPMKNMQTSSVWTAGDASEMRARADTVVAGADESWDPLHGIERCDL
jgi:hypothetical protein